MKLPGVTLALAAALVVSTLTAAEAEAKGRRDGVHAQRHIGANHHRVGPRKHAMAQRGAKHRARMHRGPQRAPRFAQPKRRHYGQRYGHWRAKHGRHAPRWHRKHRHVRHIQVVPVYAPAYYRALEIETPEFRFSVNASG